MAGLGTAMWGWLHPSPSPGTLHPRPGRPKTIHPFLILEAHRHAQTSRPRVRHIRSTQGSTRPHPHELTPALLPSSQIPRRTWPLRRSCIVESYPHGVHESVSVLARILLVLIWKPPTQGARFACKIPNAPIVLQIRVLNAAASAIRSKGDTVALPVT